MLKLKSNTIFKKIFKNFNYKKYQNSTYRDYLSANELISMFNLGIEEIEGCYFLKYYKVSSNGIKKLNEYNKSELEKDVNEICLGDYLSKPIRNERALIIGYFLFEYLYFKLKFTYPNVNFRIIISYNVKSSLKLNDCTIIFYANRKGYKYLDENLESYKFEAIAYIDTFK